MLDNSCMNDCPLNTTPNVSDVCMCPNNLIFNPGNTSCLENCELGYTNINGICKKV